MGDSLGAKCDVAVVPQVTIEKIDKTSVTFLTRSAGKEGCDDCLLRSFTVSVTEILSEPIPGAPQPVAMIAGARGTLFLSRRGWEVTSSDGFGIFGLDHAVFKWPECGAAPDRVLSELAVVPTSIIVRGH